MCKKQQKSKSKIFFSNFTEELHTGVKESNMLIVIGQIFTIIAAVIWCFSIIGLIWGLPMIMGCLKRVHKTKKSQSDILWLRLFFIL